MRKQIFFCFLFYYLLFSNNNLIAQTQAGQLVINAGVGESPDFNGDITIGFSPQIWFPIAAYDNTQYVSDDYPPWYNTSSIVPNIGFTADYGLLKWLSLGIAASYQSEVINWTPEDLGFGNGQTFTFPYTDKVSRLNIAGRLLFHLIRSKDVDFYTGFRVGASFWHDITYTPDTINPITVLYLKPPAYFIDKQNLVVASFQYLLGLRIYPSKYIGIHFELALGSPYLCEGGISFRINTKKEKAKSDATTTNK